MRVCSPESWLCPDWPWPCCACPAAEGTGWRYAAIGNGKWGLSPAGQTPGRREPRPQRSRGWSAAPALVLAQLRGKDKPPRGSTQAWGLSGPPRGHLPAHGGEGQQPLDAAYLGASAVLPPPAHAQLKPELPARQEHPWPLHRQGRRPGGHRPSTPTPAALTPSPEGPWEVWGHPGYDPPGTSVRKGPRGQHGHPWGSKQIPKHPGTALHAGCPQSSTGTQVLSLSTLVSPWKQEEALVLCRGPAALLPTLQTRAAMTGAGQHFPQEGI